MPRTRRVLLAEQAAKKAAAEAAAQQQVVQAAKKAAPKATGNGAGVVIAKATTNSKSSAGDSSPKGSDKIKEKLRQIQVLKDELNAMREKRIETPRDETPVDDGTSWAETPRDESLIIDAPRDEDLSDLTEEELSPENQTAAPPANPVTSLGS